MGTYVFYLLLPTLASLFALIYGLIHLRKRYGTFYSFVVFGFFGLAIGNIYINLIEYVGEDGMVFSLGSLGIISGFLSISFASYSLEKVDGYEIKNITKYKLIALCIPAVFVFAWLLMFLGNVGFEYMIVSTLLLFSAMPCAYRCCSLIITPYPKNSFVSCMKPFFIVTMVCCLSIMFIEVAWVFQEKSWIMFYSLALLIITVLGYVIMPILLERGYKKWIQM